MSTYLGEFPVDISTSIFQNYTPSDWAMYFVERYGQIDGDHHKLWVLDQVARILKGSEIIVKEARWNDHKPEFRVSVGTVSKEYEQWVHDMKYDVEGSDGEEYDYDEGIAP